MKISVVTVCFNAAETIGYTIESFLRQEHADKELIVIDGASSDETLAVVKTFANERMTILSEPDRGIYDAMNKGLALYGGDAVGFLNSDDCFTDEHALGHIAAALEGAEIAYGNLDFVSDHVTRRVVRRWRSSRFHRRSFVNGWMPPHPTFYVRRKVVDMAGRFDLRYCMAADYDFMLRCLELHDFEVAFIDRVLVNMMQGGMTSGVKGYVKTNFEALRSRQIWLDVAPLDRALVAKPLLKLAQFWVRE